MDGTATLTVAAAVTALTQFAKWAGIDDKHGPLAVLTLSLIGVAFWGFSAGDFSRSQLFSYFAAWLNVSLASAGIFGFTRAGGNQLTAMKEPPPGAGASPTIKN